MSESSSVSLFPVLPLRDIVVFPHMIVPLFVGREKSVRALEDVTILAIPCAPLKQLMRDVPRIGYYAMSNLSAILAERLVMANINMQGCEEFLRERIEPSGDPEGSLSCILANTDGWNSGDGVEQRIAGLFELGHELDHLH